KAWRDLFERHYPSLVRMTSSITGSVETGHDLAQESFVRLLHVRIRNHTGTFKSFLSTIAYRLALKERTRHNSHLPSDPALIADGSPSPLELAIRDETDMIIFRVIQSLSAEHREILTLRLIGGHSYEEIARMTDVPLGTVKSRMFYAVKLCREELKERGVFK
ncbi:MAG TPA: RNA polymerase sigma factor, partial [Bacteroidota bacterium]